MNEKLTYFSIIRYMPDPIREEQMNIGIIAISGDRSFAKARFLRYWDRVERFGNEDIRFLKEFAKDLEAQLPKQAPLFLDSMLTREGIEKIAINWQNSIQFSMPKVSTLPAETVLDREFKRFVFASKKDSLPAEKIQTLQSAQAVIGRLLDERFKEKELTKKLLKKNESIEGALDNHTFDIAIKNGQPYAAATAISFKVQASGYLDRELNATAWAVDDVMRSRDDLQLAVFLTSPGSNSSSKTREKHKKAFHIFESLGARAIKDSDIEDWASDVVYNLPPNITV